MKLPKYVIGLGIAGTATGLFVLYKDSLSGAKYTGEERMAGRTVIVTGASSGIGKETAKDLANRGARVIMACRDMAKCECVRSEIIESTYNKNVVCRHLDLGSLKSIREFAKSTNESEKRLDVLINNAGVMKNDRAVTEDGFEQHLGINYLGHFLLTNLLLDKLVASAPSRIINVSSIGYNNSVISFPDLNSAQYYNPKDAYKQSKLALTMFTYELAKRLQGKGVTVNAVIPGLVETDLRRDFSDRKSLISRVVLKPVWLAAFKTPLLGAQTTIYSAVEPELANQTGKIFSECTECPMDKSATNEQVSKRLWAVSERWTRLGE